jgi:hypothetical protein
MDEVDNIIPECKYHIAICFCVRNCSTYLERIFQNIKLLTDNATYKISCIFVYDNCTDSSEQLLHEYKTNSNHDVYLKHIDNTSRLRTVRIATARNACLDVIYYELTAVSHHIMADCDDINVHSWNIDTINKYITNDDNDDWDCISFNREGYYDIWALLIDDFKHHCWGFGKKSRNIVNTMRSYIVDKLNNSTENSIYCLSAFNGFAIYKTEKFKEIRYDGTYNNMKLLITDDEREKTLQLFKTKYGIAHIHVDHSKQECCEHIFYHLTAAHKNKCIIKISKFSV